MKRYSAAELDRIQKMAAAGSTGAEIAAELQTTPNRLYSVCNYYNIKLTKRPPRQLSRLDRGVLSKTIIAEAERRGMTSGQLQRQILEVIARDNMFSALLD